MNDRPESEISQPKEPTDGDSSSSKKTWSAPQLRDLGDVAKETKNSFPNAGDDGGFPDPGS